MAGVAVHRAIVLTDRCTGRGCTWNEHMGAPHHSTGPGGAILPVEGIDTHLTVGWTRLRGPILRRVAGVAVHRATVHTDRCTGRGCMWNEHMGAPHHSTGPGGAILPVFHRLV